MENLVRGIHQFQATHFKDNQEFFARLSQGQQPDTLLITCSDSRIAPDLLMQAKPGDIFTLRNAGNIIPPYGASGGGEAGTIEFAVAALKVRHVVVMGHSHCGAMKGLLNPEGLSSLPLVSSWLRHAEATRRVVQENYGDLDGEELLNATIKENVLMQIENLRTYPAVAARLTRGDLTLHGWVYHIESGQVLAFDPDQSRFVPMSDRPVATTSQSFSAIGSVANAAEANDLDTVMGRV
jgi:carbonic anhydrase